MPTPENKTDLLAAFAAARRDHQAFLATIPRARMTEPGATGPWSVKDVIAHVSAWRGRTLARLEAAAAGHPEPPPPWPADLTADSLTEDEPINAWFYERDRDLPLDTVLAAWDASFDRLAAVVAALPAATLYDPAAFPWLEGTPLADAVAMGFLGHFRDEHEPPLRAWLAGDAA